MESGNLGRGYGEKRVSQGGVRWAEASNLNGEKRKKGTALFETALWRRSSRLGDVDSPKHHPARTQPEKLLAVNENFSAQIEPH